MNSCPADKPYVNMDAALGDHVCSAEPAKCVYLITCGAHMLYSYCTNAIAIHCAVFPSCSELKEAFTAVDADANGGLSLDEAIAFTGRFGCATQFKHEAPVVPVRWDSGPGPDPFPEHDPATDQEPNEEVVVPVSEKDAEDLTADAESNEDSNTGPDDDPDEEVAPEEESSYESGPVPGAEPESDVAHIPEWESIFDTKPSHEPETDDVEVWRGSSTGCRWVLVRIIK